MRPLERDLATAPASHCDPMEDARRLAALLVTEVRLYNEEALVDLEGSAQLPGRLSKDLIGAYRRYAEEVGRSRSSKLIFVAGASAGLPEVDEFLIAATLDPEDSRPRAVRPQTR